MRPCRRAIAAIVAQKSFAIAPKRIRVFVFLYDLRPFAKSCQMHRRCWSNSSLDPDVSVFGAGSRYIS